MRCGEDEVLAAIDEIYFSFSVCTPEEKYDMFSFGTDRLNNCIGEVFPTPTRV